MNRRDFLHPRHLAHTVGQVFEAVRELQNLNEEPVSETAQSFPDLALLRFGRDAMATTFEVAIPFGMPDALPAAQAALDEVDRLEAQLTVYRETSEVSGLNRQAAGEPVVVEEQLFHLLEKAARLSTETDGAFDVATGALIKAWGFFQRCGRVPSVAERAEVQQRVGMENVVLDPDALSVQFRRRGLEINLGSIGKGYALDRAAGLLRSEWNFSAALLHGGHSSVYAMGSDPGDRRGWAVAIRHPWQPERRLAIVRLRDQGLATSAATFQHLEHEGRKLGHLLDPRTGWPAEGMASATVIAPSAAEADALATAFFILGVERSRVYCEAHPGIGAVLLPEGATNPVVMGPMQGMLDE